MIQKVAHDDFFAGFSQKIPSKLTYHILPFLIKIRTRLWLSATLLLSLRFAAARMFHLPPELITALVSMLPVGELRVGIPLGVFLGLPVIAAATWSVVGNMIPMFFIMAFLDPVSKFLMKHSKLFNKILTGIFERTRKKHTKKLEAAGAVFIIVLVAIPIPIVGGAWTGALLCYLFAVPYWKSIFYIFLGTCAAAIIMSLGVISVNEIPNFVRMFIK